MPLTHDKVLPGHNLGTHKNIKEPISFPPIFYGNLAQYSHSRIHGSFPELSRVHLSQTFVTLNSDLRAFELLKHFFFLGVIVRIFYSLAALQPIKRRGSDVKM